VSRTIPKSAIRKARSPQQKLDDALMRVATRLQQDPEFSDLKKSEKMRDVLADGLSVPEQHQSSSNMLRFVPKGRDRYLAHVLRAARDGNVAARRWWLVYSELSEAQQLRVDLDAIAVAAGTTPKEMMLIVIGAAMDLGHDVAEWTAASMHPEIVSQTAKSALRISGEYVNTAQKDREWMLQHNKFIPDQRGPRVVVNASAQAAAAAQTQPSVPTFAESVSGASAAQADAQRLIEAEIVE
jgi:hypothetical protein